MNIAPKYVFPLPSLKALSLIIAAVAEQSLLQHNSQVNRLYRTNPVWSRNKEGLEESCKIAYK